MMEAYKRFETHHCDSHKTLCSTAVNSLDCVKKKNLGGKKIAKMTAVDKT